MSAIPPPTPNDELKWLADVLSWCTIATGKEAVIQAVKDSVHQRSITDVMSFKDMFTQVIGKITLFLVHTLADVLHAVVVLTRKFENWFGRRDTEQVKVNS